MKDEPKNSFANGELNAALLGLLTESRHSAEFIYGGEAPDSIRIQASAKDVEKLMPLLERLTKTTPVPNLEFYDLKANENTPEGGKRLYLSKSGVTSAALTVALLNELNQQQDLGLAPVHEQGKNLTSRIFSGELFPRGHARG